MTDETTLHELSTTWRMIDFPSADTEVSQDLGEFITYEGFWALYNRLVPVASHGMEGGYTVARVIPNKRVKILPVGFEVFTTFNTPLDDSIQALEVERQWLHLVLSVFSKNIISVERVCGVQVFTKPKEGTKVSVWFTTIDQTTHNDLVRALPRLFLNRVEVTIVQHTKAKMKDRKSIRPKPPNEVVGRKP